MQYYAHNKRIFKLYNVTTLDAVFGSTLFFSLSLRFIVTAPTITLAIHNIRLSLPFISFLYPVRY